MNNITLDQLKYKLNEVQKYNELSEQDNESWLGESLENLYKLVIKYKELSLTQEYEESEPVIVRINHMIDKSWLQLNGIEFVFMSGIYLPLYGLVLSREEGSDLLGRGKSKMTSDRKQYINNNYCIGSCQVMNDSRLFVPKKGVLAPGVINDSHAYRILDLTLDMQ